MLEKLKKKKLLESLTSEDMKSFGEQDDLEKDIDKDYWHSDVDVEMGETKVKKKKDGEEEDEE